MAKIKAIKESEDYINKIKEGVVSVKVIVVNDNHTTIFQSEDIFKKKTAKPIKGFS